MFLLALLALINIAVETTAAIQADSSENLNNIFAQTSTDTSNEQRENHRKAFENFLNSNN